MKTSYFNQIDGLRFVAIILVLIDHFAHFIGKKFHAGYYGVDLFFVISGFLITNILLQQNGSFKLNYLNFIGRRILRIFPIYYMMIFLMYLCNYQPVHDYLIYFLTFTYNYAHALYLIPINALSHFWSLAVEEQFYILWPIFILTFKSKPKLIYTIILMIIIICNIQLFFNIFPSISRYNYVGLFPQANALSTGALGVFLFKNKRVQDSYIMKSALFEYFVLIFLLLILLIPNHDKFILCPFISLYFVLKCSQVGFKSLRINNFLSNKTIIYIGAISYGIYVYHLPLDYFLTKYIFNPLFWDKINFENLGKLRVLELHPWLIKFPVYSILSFLLAHFSYKFIEKPILTLKDKYFRY